jgi:hypothetical protein
MMKQPRNMDEALDLLAEADADLDDARRLARRHADDLTELRKAARMLFNALGKYATEAEKEEARAAYFDIPKKQ